MVLEAALLSALLVMIGALVVVTLLVVTGAGAEDGTETETEEPEKVEILWLGTL